MLLVTQRRQLSAPHDVLLMTVYQVPGTRAGVTTKAYTSPALASERRVQKINVQRRGCRKLQYSVLTQKYENLLFKDIKISLDLPYETAKLATSSEAATSQLLTNADSS